MDDVVQQDFVSQESMGFNMVLLDLSINLQLDRIWVSTNLSAVSKVSKSVALN